MTSLSQFSINLTLLQFSLSPDPHTWGSELSPDIVESDDEIHDPKFEAKNQGQPSFSRRGFVNVGCIVLLCTTLVALL